MELKVNNDTGLAALFMLKAFEGNMGGDIAGFEPELAEKLVAAKFAEPYEPGVHDEIVNSRGQARAKSLDSRLREVEAARRIQNQSREFTPAELQHDEIAEFRAWQAEQAAARGATKKYFDADSGTREQIAASGAILERPATATDLGASETELAEANATARANRLAAVSERTAADETRDDTQAEEAGAEKDEPPAPRQTGKRASAGSDEPPRPPKS